MTVIGGDGKVAGTVTDVVGRSRRAADPLSRGRASAAAAKTVLVPMTLAVVDGDRRQVEVNSIIGRQFADVPTLKSPDQSPCSRRTRSAPTSPAAPLRHARAGSEPMPVSESQLEPIRGLPGCCRRASSLLWQGSPLAGAGAAARFHGRKVAVYFGCCSPGGRRRDSVDGASAVQAAAVGLAGAAPLGGRCGRHPGAARLARSRARPRLHDDQPARGAALRRGPADDAEPARSHRSRAPALKAHPRRHRRHPAGADRDDQRRLSALWPHARPWRLQQPEPMLRAVPDAARVAAILAAPWRPRPTRRAGRRRRSRPIDRAAGDRRPPPRPEGGTA